ncbi:MAG: CPBP family intramembrane metalloprotease, partial [Bacteroidales bacterium]|nr:CPBP family intramembrane metalloprotease [Bacteroidales bacterium]
YLLKVRTYKFVLILFGFSVLLGAITTFLPEPEIEKPMVIEGLLNDILFYVFLGPVVETLVFQVLIIEVIRKIIKRPKKNICLALLISSMAFALSHTYSLSYVIFAFLGGFILALAYYFGIYRRENAFIMALLIHSLYNLSIVLYNYFFC